MYIGLDIGTSGVKGVLFEENGTMVKRFGKEYAICGVGTDIELNPNEVCSCVFDVLKQIALISKDIRAISISSLGEACVLLDENGNVLRNSILPGDVRGAAAANILMQYNDEIVSSTGLPINSTYSICKLMWIKENEPSLFKKVKHICLFGDYISYTLTGEFGISESLASRSMLYSINTKKYDPFLLNIAEIKEETLSQPLVASAKVGELTQKVADITGLPKGVSVFAGGHDQPCAAMGSGVISIGDAVDSLGTSECITTLIGDKPFSKDFVSRTHFSSEPFLQSGLFDTMAFTHTAGRLLQWFTREILSGSMTYDELNALCKNTPTGLLCLPHFSGAGTPTMDHNSVGAIIGLNLHTSKATIYQAIMEGINYEMKINIEHLENNGTKINKIFAVGGGSNSEVWLQSKADIYGIPIIKADCPEASALGAVMAASVGLGDYSSYKEATDCMIKFGKTFEPNANAVDLYSAVYAKYKKVYNSVCEIYKEE